MKKKKKTFRSSYCSVLFCSSIFDRLGHYQELCDISLGGKIPLVMYWLNLHELNFEAVQSAAMCHC